MKKDYFSLLTVLLVVFCFQSVQGQTAEQDQKAHEQKIRDQIWKSNTEIITGKPPTTITNRNDPPTITAPTVPILSRRIPGTSKEERREIEEAKEKLKAIRAPHPDDLIKYENFLQQKNTGLFKLFPDLKCISGAIIKADGNCENAVHDSYSYSFQKQFHQSGFDDIQLDEGKLWLNGFLSQGIITDIGDVPLENISLLSDYAKFLVDFKPEKESYAAKNQFWQISQKINSNGFNYGKVVKTIPDTTYLARIINYRLDKNNKPANLNRNDQSKEAVPFLVTITDKNRFDNVIAFRIVRIDNDNSITILWKQFAEKKSPELKFAKDEKWTDLKTKVK